MSKPRVPPYDLSNAFTRIDAWLRKHRPSYAAVLAKPASATAQRKLASLPELQAYLAWHDGQTDGGSSSLFGTVWLMSESQMEYQRLCNAETAKDIDNPEWWSDAWYPFADDGAGNLFCVNEGDGSVLLYWHDSEERTEVAPSLGCIFAALADALDEDVVGLDPDDDDAGLLPRDDATWAKLAERFGVTYPIAWAP